MSLFSGYDTTVQNPSITNGGKKSQSSRSCVPSDLSISPETGSLRSHNLYRRPEHYHRWRSPILYVCTPRGGIRSVLAKYEEENRNKTPDTDKQRSPDLYRLRTHCHSMNIRQEIMTPKVHHQFHKCYNRGVALSSAVQQFRPFCT